MQTVYLSIEICTLRALSFQQSFLFCSRRFTKLSLHLCSRREKPPGNKCCLRKLCLRFLFQGFTCSTTLSLTLRVLSLRVPPGAPWGVASVRNQPQHRQQ